MFCDAKFGILLLVLVLCMVIALCMFGMPAEYAGGAMSRGKHTGKSAVKPVVKPVVKRTQHKVKDMDKNPSSKSETSCRRELESLTGEKFPTVYPSWLDGLELDGYCEKLGLAFEYQGPQHTKYDKRYDKRYEDYYERVLNDEKKIRLCLENSVYLIIVDYIIPRHQLNAYLRSRIYDACQMFPRVCGELPTLSYKLPNYIEITRHAPYHNEELERDLEWVREKVGCR